MTLRFVLDAPCPCGERDFKLVAKDLVCIGCFRVAGRVNGRFRGIPDGTPGVRDQDHRCDMFSPGKPTNGGCRGDGHYLCRNCQLWDG